MLQTTCGLRLSVARDLDGLAGRRRANDRLERGDAVQYLVHGDRVGRLAADRRGERLKLGENAVEPAVLDDFGRGLAVPAGRHRVRGRGEMEIAFGRQELGAAPGAE